jgi:hypothetical protein
VNEDQNFDDWYGVPKTPPECPNVDQKMLKRIIKNDDINFLKIKRLTDLCSKPKKGEQYRIITENRYNAYTLLAYLTQSEIITDLYLAIYRINEPTVESLIGLIENKQIQRATFVISSFFRDTKKVEKWSIRLKNYCDQNINRCRHIYAHNHAKVVCAKTRTGHYVFEGSGNMSNNARIEQYVYENNKQVFDFHCAWMEEMFTSGEDLQRPESNAATMNSCDRTFDDWQAWQKTNA